MTAKLSPLPPDAPERAEKHLLAEIMTLVGYPMKPRTIEAWPEVGPAFWAGRRAVYSVGEVYAAAQKRLSTSNPLAEALDRARQARRTPQRREQTPTKPAAATSRLTK
jgi:hypothetical protein